MTCTEVRELLPDLAAGRLSPGEGERVRAHQASCPSCRGELDLFSAIASSPVPDPGPAFWSALPGTVAERIAAGPVHSRVSLPSRWALAGGVAAAAAVVWAVLQYGPSPFSQPADEDFIAAILSSPVSTGQAAELLAATGEAEIVSGAVDLDWASMEETTDSWTHPLPAGWEGNGDNGKKEDLNLTPSGAVLREKG